MTHRIAVIPGDKIGPEVIQEGLKVLRQLEDLGLASFEFTEFPWGAEHYLQTGSPMPPDGIETLKQFDAIYFGAHGDPRVPNWVGTSRLLVPMRQGLGQYANVRP